MTPEDAPFPQPTLRKSLKASELREAEEAERIYLYRAQQGLEEPGSGLAKTHGNLPADQVPLDPLASKRSLLEATHRAYAERAEHYRKQAQAAASGFVPARDHFTPNDYTRSGGTLQPDEVYYYNGTDYVVDTKDNAIENLYRRLEQLRDQYANLDKMRASADARRATLEAENQRLQAIVAGLELALSRRPKGFKHIEVV